MRYLNTKEIDDLIEDILNKKQNNCVFEQKKEMNNIINYTIKESGQDLTFNEVEELIKNILEGDINNNINKFKNVLKSSSLKDINYALEMFKMNNDIKKIKNGVYDLNINHLFKQIELLNIILNLIKKTKKLNKDNSKHILSLLEEDSVLIGLNIYTKPLSILIENIDKYFDKNLNKNKYPDSGSDLSYAIYERKIFEKNNINNNYCITLKNGKKYKIENIKDSLLYYKEVVIPEFIIEELKKDNSNIPYNEKLNNINRDITITLMNELMNFHKLTYKLSDDFSKTLVLFCNKDFCNSGQLWENYPAIKNLEDNIEKPLLNMNELVWKDVFYEFQNSSYGEKELLFPRENSEFHTIFTYKIKSQLDFCKWFFYDFKN